MPKPSANSALRALCIALMIGTPMGVTVSVYPVPAMAKAARTQALPRPYTSRALKAVLMPVTKASAAKFRLPKGAKGVVVVSVKPGGVAQAAGLKPGDTISEILGRKIKKPQDVDAIFKSLLGSNASPPARGYGVSGYRRGGATFIAWTPMTYDIFYEPFDIYAVGSWVSFSYGSFSYSEYYASYSSVIVETYEYSETYIEQRVSEESFVSTMSYSESSFTSYDQEIYEGSYVSGGEGSVWTDETAEVTYSEADDASELAINDTAFLEDADIQAADAEEASYEDAAPVTEEAAPEATEEQPADEAAAEEQPADEAAAEEQPADEAAAEEQPADEAAAEEQPADEAAAEEQPADEAAVEEQPADEGAYEEQPADEAAAEEQPADEGAYEEQPADEAAAEEQPADEGAYEEQPAEEPAMEEAPAEEPAMEEAPAEEPAMEEAPAEEAPAEEPACAGEIIDGVCQG